MTKHFYAARHTHDTRFSYSGGGWSVYIFGSKAQRDAFVHESNTRDIRNGYNTRSEPVSRNTARYITGNNVEECLLDSGVTMLIQSTKYHNTRYWG